MLQKINQITFGIIIGLILPLFTFFCTWLFIYSYMSFPKGFWRYLKNGDMLQEYLILSVCANALLFYYFLNKKLNPLCKGLLIACFMYVGFIFYISIQ